MSQTRVIYPGFIFTEGQRSCPRKGKKPFTASPIRTVEDQLKGFPGMAGFSSIWTPNYGLIARPLYENLKGKDNDPSKWNLGYKGAF